CLALSENFETPTGASKALPLAAARTRTHARDESSAATTEICKRISWLCHCSDTGHDSSGITFTWVVANRSRPYRCDRNRSSRGSGKQEPEVRCCAAGSGQAWSTDRTRHHSSGREGSWPVEASVDRTRTRRAARARSDLRAVARRAGQSAGG